MRKERKEAEVAQTMNARKAHWRDLTSCWLNFISWMCEFFICRIDVDEAYECELRHLLRLGLTRVLAPNSPEPFEYEGRMALPWKGACKQRPARSTWPRLGPPRKIGTRLYRWLIVFILNKIRSNTSMASPGWPADSSEFISVWFVENLSNHLKIIFLIPIVFIA